MDKIIITKGKEIKISKLIVSQIFKDTKYADILTSKQKNIYIEIPIWTSPNKEKKITFLFRKNKKNNQIRIEVKHSILKKIFNIENRTK